MVPNLLGGSRDFYGRLNPEDGRDRPDEVFSFHQERRPTQHQEKENRRMRLTPMFRRVS